MSEEIVNESWDEITDTEVSRLKRSNSLIINKKREKKFDTDFIKFFLI